jgi:hypothetical protein
LLPSRYFYDVENVACQWAVHLKRPCEDGSTKRVQNVTLSTVTAWVENGFSACFEVMLTCSSVAHLFIQNQSKSIKTKAVFAMKAT